MRREEEEALKAPNTTARRRAQFVFPGRVIEKLDQLKEQMGAASRTEVLKTSVGLLHRAMSRLARGEEIAAVRDGRISETIAIPGARPP